MKNYDVIVIGSGSGMEIVGSAVSMGMKVALVDKGPLGGTCLNLGCIPSKMLIYPADVIAKAKEAEKLGLDIKVEGIDFRSIMERMRSVVQEGRYSMRRGIEQGPENLDFYESNGYFVDDYTMEIDGEDEQIRGEKIFIVAGSRPLIPPIKGIKDVDYLTNETVLELKRAPKSIIMIGGGYISAEYSHFFESMGSEVTVLQRNEHLIPGEEPEISELLERKMKERMNVHTSTEVVEVREDGDFVVMGEDMESGERTAYRGEKVMVAAGRRSNADLLKVENTGVETDKRGYIKVNGHLKTSKENIWALGDIIGKQMFKHVANRESQIAWHNSIHERKVAIDYLAAPHAIFSHPQIASVGLRENDAREKYDILVGTANYIDVAKGEAMVERDAFTKGIVDKESGKILGFHIIGPYASILIQEVVNIMASDEGVSSLGRGMHIHPALTEVILATFSNLREPSEMTYKQF